MTKLKHTSGELALKIGDDKRRATIITEDGREVMNIEVSQKIMSTETFANALAMTAAGKMLETLVEMCPAVNGHDYALSCYYFGPKLSNGMCGSAQKGTCKIWNAICAATGHYKSLPFDEPLEVEK